MQESVTAIYHVSGWERLLLIAIPIVSVLAFLLVLGYSIYRSSLNYRHWKKTKEEPLQQIQATLYSKRLVSSPNPGIIYLATFVTQDGHHLELSIPQSEYQRLVEGNLGLISYQGTQFVRFDPNI